MGANGHLANDVIFDSFFPYGSGWTKGVRLAGGDTDRDFTGDEVITAPGAASGSKQVKIYDDDTARRLPASCSPRLRGRSGRCPYSSASRTRTTRTSR